MAGRAGNDGCRPCVAPLVEDEQVLPREPMVAESATGAAVGVGAVSGLVVFLGLNPLLVNLHGPFGEHAALGLLTLLALAVVSGVAVGVAVRALARRSTWGLVSLVAGLAALAVVAFPTQIDQHESFVERPNERSSCLGFAFRHYPPNTFDANDEVYCVGLESPLPEG